MGGNLYGGGNTVAVAEFNFFTDLEAATVVLQKAVCPMTIILEAVLQGTVSCEAYCSVGSKTGRIRNFLRDITPHETRSCPNGVEGPGVVVGDFVAVLAAAVPESIVEVHRVEVALAGQYTLRQLVHTWEPKCFPT
ncbi:uncharacterized protein LOC144119674 [Amblyomma americanum]